MRNLLLVLCGLAMLSATPAAADSCIRQNDIRNWSSVNDKTLILENFRHQKWTVKLIGTCSDFKYRESLVIKSRGGFALSCVQLGDTIITRDFGISGRCAIASVERYTPPATIEPAGTIAPAHPTY